MALSTTEAEYMAITKVIWLRGLFSELVSEKGAIVVYCDSQSVIHLTKDQMHHERTKHIDIQYHFVQEVIAQGDAQVHKIGTKNNPVDMMAKSLQISKFSHFLDLVNIQ